MRPLASYSVLSLFSLDNNNKPPWPSTDVVVAPSSQLALRRIRDRIANRFAWLRFRTGTVDGPLPSHRSRLTTSLSGSAAGTEHTRRCCRFSLRYTAMRNHPFVNPTSISAVLGLFPRLACSMEGDWVRQCVCRFNVQLP